LLSRAALADCSTLLAVGPDEGSVLHAPKPDSVAVSNKTRVTDREIIANYLI
jgi:hypothetical protein